MTAVSEISQVLSSIEKVKEGADNYSSNLYLDLQKLELWIRLQILEMEVLEGTIFIIRRNKEFFNLYYISNSTQSLKLNLNILQNKYSNQVFVVDLVGIEDKMPELQTLFLHNGYYLYASLMRMSKLTHDSIIRVAQHKNIINAKIANATTILDHFIKYFDPLCEQIPLVEEINKWIDNEQLMIYSADGVIQGFLIFEKIGQTAYLRYWFVHPDHRNQKVGSALMQFFFDKCISTKRQIFWVIRSNTNAIKRYEHYGFKSEPMIDDIFINRNIRYEGKNN